MGSTKVKIIDDSKNQTPKDSLVESLKTELGIKKDKKAAPEEKRLVQQTEVTTKKTALKAKPPSKAKKIRSKKYQQSQSQIDKSLYYKLDEAVELVKKTSYTTFPGTVEAHINTNIKNVRGQAHLPFSTGKQLKILAFGKDASSSGADIIGTEKTLSDLQVGKINFDILVTTPEWMPKIVPLAKILGPKGLMPNPKNNTVTENLSKTISELKEGKVEYKTEQNGQVIHIAIGKVNQPKEEISSNLKTLYSSIGKSKIKKITLSPTMGPSVKVNLSSI